MREREDKRAFLLLDGSPTITFAADGAERMLPYHSFVKGRLEKGKIALQFGDLVIAIDGDPLQELWEGLQTQDVRRVQVSPGGGAEAGECVITRISIRIASDSTQG